MKYVLVTGAGGGMGQAAVAALQKAGYTVFAMDRVAVSETAGVVPVQADVTCMDSLTQAYAQVSKRTERLDAIVHFAGIYVLDSLVEMEQSHLEKVFGVNVLGAMAVNRVFLPLLGKGSRIVLTTSELAPLDPLPFTGLYAVTKAALDKYAFSLRMELQLLGIGVAVLRPGAVNTGMLGVSTDALDRFCRETQRYRCNAVRFKKVVDMVEARHVPAEKVGKKIVRILSAKHPRYVYSLNRNPLLLLMHVLPPRMQTWAVKQILK